MKKLGIIITSYCGKIIKELEVMNFYISPLQIYIDDEKILEGNYELDKRIPILEKVRDAKNCQTSLPPINMIQDQMKELSAKYDDVLYMSINSKLSGTYEQVLHESQNYKNVTVFNSHLSGGQFISAASKVKNIYNETQDMEKVLSFLNDFNDNTIGFITPESLDPFIKSGRVKGFKKVVGKLLKIIPLINVDANDLDSVYKSRSKRNNINKAFDKLEEFILSKKLSWNDFEVRIIRGLNDSTFDLTLEIAKERNVIIDTIELSSVVTMIHTGVNAQYLGISPKIN